MSLPRRPGRPTTRVPQSRPAAAPAPAARPATSRVPPVAPRPAAAPPAPQARPTSRVSKPATSRAPRSERASASRGPSSPGAPKNNTPILIGAGVGGLVLIVILVVVLGGGKDAKKPVEASNAKKAVSKPVDVGALEREGMQKCEEGLRIVQGSAGLMKNNSLSPSEKAKLKSDLERANSLLRSGVGCLSDANFKSDNKYDVTSYQEALKTVRMKLGELGGN